MNPTYTIREVLNLIDGATVEEMQNLVKLLQDEMEQYTKAEVTVIMDYIMKRREDLQKNSNSKLN